MSKVTVFISYSHDSDAHRERVLALSERLRTDGIETILDQYVNGSPQQGWPRWMLDQLDAADSVLVMCTETYYRRFRGHEVPGKGKGVDWEGALITQEIYGSRSQTLKFVPAMFNPADEAFVPEPLRSHTHYVLNAEQAYQSLYDFLLGQANVAPGPVGQPRLKVRTPVAPLTFESSAPAAPAALAARVAASGTPAVKMLIVSASPRDCPTLGVDVEIREIRKAVRSARLRDHLQIVTETAVLADDFAGCLREHAPQILHFSGYHVMPSGIMLMDESGNSKPVPQAALLHVVRGQPGLRGVVLNTCYSLASATDLAQVVDFAIGVEGLLNDDSAILFAKGFFGALADGLSLQSAYDLAIAPLIGKLPAQNIPQLRTHPRIHAAAMVLVADVPPAAATPAAAESAALGIWRKRLAFLQAEEAKTADAAQKFSIQQGIEEAQDKIRTLGGG